MKKIALLSAGVLLAAAVSPLIASPTKASAAEKRTTITFWHAMSNQNKTELGKLVKDFNKSQSKFVVKASSQGDYNSLQQKYLAAAKSKQLPVMAQSAYYSVPAFVKNGLIAPLDTEMKADHRAGVKALKRMYPGFSSSARFDGHYYSVPFAKSLRVMVYNQDLLNKYHLSVPKSWQDLQNDAQTLQKDKISAVGFDQSFGSELEGLAVANGQDFVTMKNKRVSVNYDKKKVLEPLNMIMDMINKGQAMTSGNEAYGDANFASGKTLVYFTSSAGLPYIQSYLPKGMKWGATVVPSYKGKTRSLTGGSDLIMSASASKKQRQGAWRFMDYLISKKATTDWAVATGYVPLTKAAVQSAKYQDFLKKNTEFKAMSDSLPYAFTAANYPGYDAVWSASVDSVDKMLSEKANPTKTMQALSKKAKQLIQQAR